MPWGKIIPRAIGRWEKEIQSGGFVQLFRNGISEAAFGFENLETLVVGLPTVLSSIPGGKAGLEAKLVCLSSVSNSAREVLQKHEIPVFKLVERPTAFFLRFECESGKVLVAALERAPPSLFKRRIRVLIVDDSPTIRKLLQHILGSDSELEVVGAVGLPSEVEAALEKLKPDVVTLDIHLPEMNGVELLRQYLPKYPLPTVMISSISVEEGPLVLSALEAGAVDYIQKPGAQEIATVSSLILQKVKTAASATLRVAAVKAQAKIKVDSDHYDLGKLVAIGSSTGGTEALKEIFVRLPKNIPPILVVQHIPAVFSKAFAERLHSLCSFEVLEGEDGMKVQPGRAIIAPGGKHMTIVRKPTGLEVRILDSEPVNRHKPSVDVLMEDVAKICGSQALGVILTGMGADGAKGLLAMKNSGAVTFGQDEASCVVYGMPFAAHKLGATSRMIPLGEMAEAITLELQRKKRSA